MTEIRVPTLGESVTEATIGRWFKKPGDAVAVDEPLVELETDKVTIEVPAPAAGVLSEIAARDGETVAVGAKLGDITDGAAAAQAAAAPAATAPGEQARKPAPPSERPAPPPADGEQTTKPAPPSERSAPPPANGEQTTKPAPPSERPAPRPADGEQTTKPAPPSERSAPPPAEQPASKPGPGAAAPSAPPQIAAADAPLAPSVRRLGAESGIAPATVPGTGKDGRVTKGDMLAAIERAAAAPTAVSQPAASVQLRAPSPPDDAAREERVRMTRLRQTIARRLKDAQNTAATLTTFNEADMGAVMALRAQYRELFEKKHGVKLGFMGFFVRACVRALKEIPAVNAEIDGTDIVYKNYYHVGIAVSTDKGLVVPVVRDCDAKSLAEIEKEIAALGRRARDGALKIEDMQGGTFTITNGGIYGSLMSTPILNAPQSGILGMHKIQERPAAVGGKVEVRPMMYLALSYDHRIVDGSEAVTFLVRVKESIEDPARLVIDL